MLLVGGADPQCVACGTSSRMKCIWLNDAEFSFLRYQPWQCLRCAVNHSFEAAHPGGPQGTAAAARRNLCIWFTRVTRLKANYTELQCKMLSGAEGRSRPPPLLSSGWLTPASRPCPRCSRRSVHAPMSGTCGVGSWMAHAARSCTVPRVLQAQPSQKAARSTSSENDDSFIFAGI